MSPPSFPSISKIDFRQHRPASLFKQTAITLDSSYIASTNGTFVFVYKEASTHDDEDERMEDDEEEEEQEEEENQSEKRKKDLFLLFNLMNQQTIELEVNEEDFSPFKSAPDFSKDFYFKDPQNILVLVTYELNDHDELYQGHQSKFRINFETKKLERVSEWSIVLSSFMYIDSQYYFSNFVLFLCRLSRNELKLVKISIETGRIEKEANLSISNSTENHWWHYQTKHANCFDEYFYGFECYNQEDICTRAFLNSRFREIITRNLETGKIGSISLSNSLKCLGISQEAFSRNAEFFIDSDWLDQRLYLHASARNRPVRQCPLDYFAVLDLQTRMWTPILMDQPTQKLLSPMLMLLTPNDQMVLLRSNMVCDKEEESTLEVYRIQMRKPDSLMNICSTVFRRQFMFDLEEKRESNKIVDYYKDFCLLKPFK